MHGLAQGFQAGLAGGSLQLPGVGGAPQLVQLSAVLAFGGAGLVQAGLDGGSAGLGLLPDPGSLGEGDLDALGDPRDHLPHAASGAQPGGLPGLLTLDLGAGGALGGHGPAGGLQAPFGRAQPGFGSAHAQQGLGLGGAGRGRGVGGAGALGLGGVHGLGALLALQLQGGGNRAHRLLQGRGQPRLPGIQLLQVLPGRGELLLGGAHQGAGPGQGRRTGSGLPADAGELGAGGLGLLAGAAVRRGGLLVPGPDLFVGLLQVDDGGAGRLQAAADLQPGDGVGGPAAGGVRLQHGAVRGGDPPDRPGTGGQVPAQGLGGGGVGHQRRAGQEAPDPRGEVPADDGPRGPVRRYPGGRGGAGERGGHLAAVDVPVLGGIPQGVIGEHADHAEIPLPSGLKDRGDPLPIGG
ncbi:Uncharacterised protein [Mycobacteroides abscessus subsp. abscessus]|nr:Uncharacterised protein [Mycobacteroides abscessus subsp. abscessus]